MTAPVTPQWAHCAAPALPGADGVPVVLMVATPDTTVRDEARALARTALRGYLAPLIGCAPAAVPLQIEPGKAPQLALAGRPLQLSISHEAGLTLAAMRSGGKVGVDLMRIPDAPLPDWQALAQDYLGPEALAALSRLGAGQQQHAFARAWTRHEAALKCLGLQLQEWTPGLARQLASCELGALALPGGYVGALALSP
jgi:4'-phosphopantetheinyl transferase